MVLVIYLGSYQREMILVVFLVIGSKCESLCCKVRWKDFLSFRFNVQWKILICLQSIAIWGGMHSFVRLQSFDPDRDSHCFSLHRKVWLNFLVLFSFIDDTSRVSFWILDAMIRISCWKRPALFALTAANFGREYLVWSGFVLVELILVCIQS
jgi:hypothetical protein